MTESVIIANAAKMAVGLGADVTIIDPRANVVIDPSSFRSKGRNCPFAGWKVTTQAVMTILGGDIVHQRAEALVEA